MDSARYNSSTNVTNPQGHIPASIPIVTICQLYTCTWQEFSQIHLPFCDDVFVCPSVYYTANLKFVFEMLYKLIEI